MSFFDHKEWLDVAIQVAAIAGIVWGISKVPYHRWRQWIKSKRKDRRMLDTDVPGLVKSVDELSKALAVIQLELVPNHGTSLRDAINRIECLAIKSDRTAEAWLNLDDRAMYMTNAQGEMTWCNRAYVTISGLPKEELYGLGFLSTIAKHDLDRVSKVISDFADRGIFTNAFEFDMTNPDNGIFRVTATNHVMHDAKGELTGIVGYVHRANPRSYGRRRSDLPPER